MKKLLPILAALLASCGHKPLLEVKKVEPKVAPTHRFAVTTETFSDGVLGGYYMQFFVVYDTATSNETVIAKSHNGMAVISHREIR